MIYVLMTVIFWGLTPVLDKIASANADVSVIVFIRSITVAIASTIIVALGGKWSMIPQVSGKVLACMICSGFLAGCAGVFTFMRAMQEVGDAGKVAVLTSTYPLVALILTVAILKEPVTVQKVLGTILITSGVVLLNR
ncbi:MAG: EamA family transporter [Candidatus Riflebacteria bacterium]|nr:EamA family transporter [Candidatus Riflebacteria bacterium]